MPTYKWYGVHGTLADVTTTATLGYPWIDNAAPQTEIAGPTADAVLSKVGTDKTLAASEHATEIKRKTPRPALTKKLKKIAE